MSINEGSSKSTKGVGVDESEGWFGVKNSGVKMKRRHEGEEYRVEFGSSAEAIKQLLCVSEQKARKYALHFETSETVTITKARLIFFFLKSKLKCVCRSIQNPLNGIRAFVISVF